MFTAAFTDTNRDVLNTLNFLCTLYELLAGCDAALPDRSRLGSNNGYRIDRFLKKVKSKLRNTQFRWSKFNFSFNFRSVNWCCTKIFRNLKLASSVVQISVIRMQTLENFMKPLFSANSNQELSRIEFFFNNFLPRKKLLSIELLSLFKYQRATTHAHATKRKKSLETLKDFSSIIASTFTRARLKRSKTFPIEFHSNTSRVELMCFRNQSKKKQKRNKKT